VWEEQFVAESQVVWSEMREFPLVKVKSNLQICPVLFACLRGGPAGNKYNCKDIPMGPIDVLFGSLFIVKKIGIGVGSYRYIPVYEISFIPPAKIESANFGRMLPFFREKGGPG